VSKSKIFIVLITLSLVISSCQTAREDCDPTIYCNTDYPDSGYVDITVTEVGTNGFVPITIYDGDVEDNKIVLTDTLYTTTTYYYLPVKKRFSAKAVYVKAGITTQVFDATKIKITRFWNCDERCYEVRDGKLNLQLE
jgi:hypothetical protein